MDRFWRPKSTPRRPVSVGFLRDGLRAEHAAHRRFYTAHDDRLLGHVGSRGYPGCSDRFIKVGKEARFDFNLADACKLTLRAADEAGRGIAGVSFSMERQTGESGGAVIGDNLGPDCPKQRKEVTDKDGHLGPHDGSPRQTRRAASHVRRPRLG